MKKKLNKRLDKGNWLIKWAKQNVRQNKNMKRDIRQWATIKRKSFTCIKMANAFRHEGGSLVPKLQVMKLSLLGCSFYREWGRIPSYVVEIRLGVF